MMDDQSSADAHFQAMMEMVRSLGGLQAFDDYTKERMTMLDIWRSGWTLTHPSFQLTWDPGHLSEGIRSEIRSDGNNFCLGSTFDRPETADIFDVRLLNLVASLTEVANLTRYSFKYLLAPNEFQWLLLCRTAVEHSLLCDLANTSVDGITSGTLTAAPILAILI